MRMSFLLMLLAGCGADPLPGRWMRSVDAGETTTSETLQLNSDGTSTLITVVAHSAQATTLAGCTETSRTVATWKAAGGTLTLAVSALTREITGCVAPADDKESYAPAQLADSTFSYTVTGTTLDLTSGNDAAGYIRQ
jgi:hypothetical protein